MMMMMMMGGGGVGRQREWAARGAGAGAGWQAALYCERMQLRWEGRDALALISHSCTACPLPHPPTPPSTPQDMTAAGVEPDSVTHTMLLMAHEKAGQWEEALGAYRGMQAAGLQRNSFTYRCGGAGAGGGVGWGWVGVGGRVGTRRRGESGGDSGDGGCLFRALGVSGV